MIAVNTGIRLVKALAFPTPILLMAKVKKIKAKDDPKNASSSNGIQASWDNPVCLKSLKSKIKNSGANKNIPIRL